MTFEESKSSLKSSEIIHSTTSADADARATKNYDVQAEAHGSAQSAVQHAKEHDASTPTARLPMHETGAASYVRRTTEHVVDEAQEILHDAGALALDSCRAGSDYLAHKAEVIGKRAEQIVASATVHVGKGRRATTRFVNGNVGLLLLMGAGLSWMGLRMLGRRPKRTPEVTVRRASPSTYTPLDVPVSAAPSSAGTTSGAKLMGVRARDIFYVE